LGTKYVTGRAKTFASLLMVSGAIYLLGHYVVFGSLTRNCIYTEEILPVPKTLAKGTIVVGRQAYLAKGIDRETSCLPIFGKIKQEIVGPATIGNLSIGEKYFTEGGRTVQTLATGTEFKVTGVAKVTKHGINSIFSGPGPLYFLILKDKADLDYRIHTTETGINEDEDELFLTYVSASAKSSESTTQNFLSSLSFKYGPDSFSFTGRLVEPRVRK
jgi:hypothetical protein